VAPNYGLDDFTTQKERLRELLRPQYDEYGMYGPVRYSRTSYMYTVRVARWVDWPTRSSYCVEISTEALRVYM
jgi:hypothetical protein